MAEQQDETLNSDEENDFVEEQQPLEQVEEEETPPSANKSQVGFVCTTCGATFAKKFNRDRHVRLSHNNIVRVYDCTFCGAFFDTVEKLRQHRQSHKPSTGFEEKSSAFRKKCVVYRKTYEEKMLTLENAFMSIRRT